MKVVHIILILMIAIVLTNCKIQEPIIIKADANNGLQPGGCYFSIMKNDGTKKESPFILEIVPPEYELTEKFYSDTDLEQYSIGKGKYQFKVRDIDYKFFMNKQDDLSKFTTVANPVGYMYCMVESPIEYITLTKEQFHKRDNKIPLMKTVRQSKVIKSYVRKKPKSLKENQYFFDESYWTKEKRAVAGSH
jgi:hypothetical protein